MPTKVKHPRRLVARRDRNYKAVFRGTDWGNPYRITRRCTREQALARYEHWLDKKLAKNPHFLEPLRGYNLGCFCPRGASCHADILLRRLYQREVQLRSGYRVVLSEEDGWAHLFQAILGETVGLVNELDYTPPNGWADIYTECIHELHYVAGQLHAQGSCISLDRLYHEFTSQWDTFAEMLNKDKSSNDDAKE